VEIDRVSCVLAAAGPEYFLKQLKTVPKSAKYLENVSPFIEHFKTFEN
jgi:hypothetical protein